jgi:phosphatidylglycerol:prolipoprotein diacylglycerol transferase
MHSTLELPGGITVGSYALFFVLAWIVGGVVFYREFRRRGWPLETMLFVMIGCIVGAVLGAIVLSVLFLDWPEALERVLAFDFSGKTVIGGIAGGFIGVELTKKIVGYPHSTGDAFALAIPVGLVVGRVGCLLGGCCFGTVTSMPWAIEYPPATPAYLVQLGRGLIDAQATASLPVHPAPVYELVFYLGLFVLLFHLRDRFAVRGTLFRLYLALYAGFRFVAEFFRGDTTYPDAGGLKPVQYLMLGVALYYGYVVYKNSRRKTVGDTP